MVPLDSGVNYRFSLIFDNTGSIANGFAMVNPLLTAVTTTLIFKDETGTPFVTDNSITLPPLGHQSFVFATRFPTTVGKRGTVEISTSGTQMNVLGLRFGTSAISSILPLVGWDWAAGAPAPPMPPSPYTPPGY